MRVSRLQNETDISLVTLPQANVVTKASRTKRWKVACTNCSVMVGSAASLASSVRRGDSMMWSRARRARECLNMTRRYKCDSAAVKKCELGARSVEFFLRVRHFEYLQRKIELILHPNRVSNKSALWAVTTVASHETCLMCSSANTEANLEVKTGILS